MGVQYSSLCGLGEIVSALSWEVIYPLGSMKKNDWGQEVRIVKEALGNKLGRISKLKFKGPSIFS